MNERADFHIAAWRLILDLSFFILITTIGLNIVFGIIVDSFSELRDERVRNTEFPCDINVNSKEIYVSFRQVFKKIKNRSVSSVTSQAMNLIAMARYITIMFLLVNIIDHEELM